MTMTEMEHRLVKLEKTVASFPKKAEPANPADPNAWMDAIHGTFQNDAAYRRAAKLGRAWRESQLHRKQKTKSKASKK